MFFFLLLLYGDSEMRHNAPWFSYRAVEMFVPCCAAPLLWKRFQQVLPVMNHQARLANRAEDAVSDRFTFV